MSLKVFISHSHQDRELAKALVNFLRMAVRLESKEIRCTSYLPAGLDPGAKINEALRRDIEDCEFFFPLITTSSLKSEFVFFEIGAAWGLEQKIWPIIEVKGRTPKLPSLLTGLVHTNISDLEELARLTRKMNEAIWIKRDQVSDEEQRAAAEAFLHANGAKKRGRRKKTRQAQKNEAGGSAPAASLSRPATFLDARAPRQKDELARTSARRRPERACGSTIAMVAAFASTFSVTALEESCPRRGDGLVSNRRGQQIAALQ
jgi:hypothetical protein